VLVQDNVYTRFVTIVVLSFCVSQIRFVRTRLHVDSARVVRRRRGERDRRGVLDGGTVNSLKSILKMLEALAVLKYSRRKKEVQPRLQRERNE